MKKIKLLTLLSLVVASSFFLSACGKKPATTTNQTKTVNQTLKTIDLKPEERPYISLVPRADGHLLTLKIDGVKPSVTQLDYELIYTVHDKATNQDIEKGVGNTVKEISQSIQKDLLLGTESCTSGCKYSYDEGVTGGTLTLTLTTTDGQATFETPFVLKTSADIKKDGGISLPSESITINATTSTKSDFFIMLENYKDKTYSVFSNGNGAGKITSINPSTITKSSMTSLVGDYLAQ